MAKNIYLSSSSIFIVAIITEILLFLLGFIFFIWQTLGYLRGRKLYNLQPEGVSETKSYKYACEDSMEARGTTWSPLVLLKSKLYSKFSISLLSFLHMLSFFLFKQYIYLYFSNFIGE